MKQNLVGIQRLMGPHTITVGKFDVPPHLCLGHLNKKVNQETTELKYTTEQVNLTDV